MSKKRGYELLLLITYIAMAVVCIYLNFFTVLQAGGITNVLVNIAMFIIVGLILIFSTGGSLRPAARMTADLIRVTEKIEDTVIQQRSAQGNPSGGKFPHPRDRQRYC